MPSVNSSSRPSVGDSSTVITPSLPTLLNASAISSPICESCAEIVATLAISSCSPTSRAASVSRSDTAAVAASMPFFIAIGLAPAVTALRPSRTMAWASTVAVVVPSPATSLVLVATSLASWAPRFSYRSSSSTSRATVTPSLVMVGAPHFLSITTLRPLGPSVTFTASARRFTPRSSARRASSLNSRLFAIEHLGVGLWLICESLGLRAVRSAERAHHATAPDRAAGRRSLLREPRAEPGRCQASSGSPGAGQARAREICSLLLDDREHVAGGEHQVLLAVVLHFGAAVLAVQHDIANFDVHGDTLGTGVVETTGPNGQDLALLGLLLSGVWDHQARCGGLLGLERAHHDPVFERF